MENDAATISSVYPSGGAVATAPVATPVAGAVVAAVVQLHGGVFQGGMPVPFARGGVIASPINVQMAAAPIAQPWPNQY